MITKKRLFAILWVLIAIIALASIICLLVLPKWKGIFIAGCGGFLVVNIFIAMFFIQNNYRNRQ